MSRFNKKSGRLVVWVLQNPGTPRPTIYKWLAINWMMNQIFTWKMVGNHQTSIKKIVLWSSRTGLFVASYM